MTIETIKITDDVRIRIEQDQDPMSPTEWDNVGKIAYSSSRYALGTESVSKERLDEISKGIREGSLIGLPVYAYVHSGSTISCGNKLKDGTIVYGNPFSCPWDSGQSGFVYCTKEKAIKEWGKKICTKAVITKAKRYMACEVDTYNQYMNGDVYGFIVEIKDGDDWSEFDSCWGHYGLEYCIEEARNSAFNAVKSVEREKTEKAHWAERDVCTAAA